MPYSTLPCTNSVQSQFETFHAMCRRTMRRRNAGHGTQLVHYTLVKRFLDKRSEAKLVVVGDKRHTIPDYKGAHSGFLTEAPRLFGRKKRMYQSKTERQLPSDQRKRRFYQHALVPEKGHRAGGTLGAAISNPSTSQRKIFTKYLRGRT